MPAQPKRVVAIVFIETIAAQLEASVTAGRVYLAAYALGLGATGLTFRDDAVTGFLSPHAKDKSAMFLVAVGKKVRRI